MHVPWRPVRDCIRNLLAAFALLFLFVTCTPLTRWWASSLATEWREAGDGDVLVVLAGSDLGDVLGESSYLRAVYAVRAMRVAKYRRVVLCGTGGSLRIRDFIAGSGLSVTPDRVLVDNDSLDTRQNAMNALRLLQQYDRDAASPPRIVMLTSDYHIYRARRVFEKAGVTVAPFPVPDVLKRYGFPSRRWNAFLDLCLETAKIGYYRLKQWI